MLETLKQRPSTAVPGLGELASYYERLLQRHENVVYPIPSYRLSGLLNAAVQAAKQVEDAKIVVIDPPEEWEEGLYAVRSKDPRIEDQLMKISGLSAPVIAVMNTDFASGAAGLIAMAAVNAIREGKHIDEIVRRMIDAKRRTGIFLILNTLEYVVDRVGEMQAFLGTLLRIKPVLTLRHGYLESVARVRGERKAMRRMIELVKQKVGDGRIDAYVLHTLAPAKAEDFLQQIESELNVRNSWIDDAGASISRFIGRGGLGIAFLEV
jgi:fatty acid-binding protein DegV